MHPRNESLTILNSRSDLIRDSLLCCQLRLAYALDKQMRKFAQGVKGCYRNERMHRMRERMPLLRGKQPHRPPVHRRSRGRLVEDANNDLRSTDAIG